MELNEDELELANKLEDAGMTGEQAHQWVSDIIIAAEKRPCRCEEKADADPNEKTRLEVGDWVELYGVPFMVDQLLLHHDKPPRVVLKHPMELMEEPSRRGVTFCVGVLGCQAVRHNHNCPELGLPGIG